MSDLRARLPAYELMTKTLSLHSSTADGPSDESQSWYSGALGEMIVGGILSQLPAGWTVLHSVPVGDGHSDIDHVVVGPPGVLTLNTKTHPGRKIWAAGFGLFVGDRRTRYIPAASQEAEDASRRLSSASGLSVPVVPVLVFVDAGQIVVKAAPEGGVTLLRDADLLTFLLGLPQEFSEEQVRRIAFVASRPSTWTTRDVPDLDRTSAIRFHALVARDLQRSSRVPAPTRRASGPTRTANANGSSRPRARSHSRRQPSVVTVLARIALIFGAVWFLLGIALPAFLHAAISAL